MHVHEPEPVYRSFKWSSRADAPVLYDGNTRAAVESMYERMDANGDGVVTQEQLEECVGNLQHPNRGLAPPHFDDHEEVLMESFHGSGDGDHHSLPTGTHYTDNNQRLQMSRPTAHADTKTVLPADRVAPLSGGYAGSQVRTSYSVNAPSGLDLEGLRGENWKLRQELENLQWQTLAGVKGFEDRVPPAVSTTPTILSPDSFTLPSMRSSSAGVPPGEQTPSAFGPPVMRSSGASLTPSMQSLNRFVVPSMPGPDVSTASGPQSSVPRWAEAREVPRWPDKNSPPPSMRPSPVFVPPCVVPPPSAAGMRGLVMAFPTIPVRSEMPRARSPARDGLMTKASQLVGGDLFFKFPSNFNDEDELKRVYVGFGANLDGRSSPKPRAKSPEPWTPMSCERAPATPKVQPPKVQPPRVADEQHPSMLELRRQQAEEIRQIIDRQRLEQEALQQDLCTQPLTVVVSPRSVSRSGSPTFFDGRARFHRGCRSQSPPLWSRHNSLQNADLQSSQPQTPCRSAGSSAAVQPPKSAFSIRRTTSKDDSGLEANFFSRSPGRSRRLAGGRVAW